ncbi:MAG TPA: SAM-dependent chlorinase/fluorinase, partial [Polyangiales bacterium]|nr:SAM-dependent chlorinase/fluorinase [Polyangiales bacterium]
MPTRVTLTTDFGTRDPYVAQLKGVLYAQGPSSLEVVDLSHEIEAQNIREAALFVRTAWPRFPHGTIHIAVVDPGVGSVRRALAIEHAGQYWLAPDNGLLSWLLMATGDVRAVALDHARFGTAPLSATFHGRDLFAPAAALIARGAALDQLGESTSDWTQLAWRSIESTSSGLRGEIIHVDRFGNLITNLSRSDLAVLGEAWTVRVGTVESLPRVRCYADASPGVAVALIGSSELLEIAVRD